MTRIDVALCVDREFVMPLAVALASLDRVAGDDDVVVHVLHPGLPPEVQARVVAPLERLTVVWLVVDEATVADARPSVFLTSASVYRLLLADLLPAQIERVIYLDADTLVLRSLAGLAELEFSGGDIVAAVREAATPWAAGPLGPDWRSLGLDPGSPYFNSGVLLIDLAAWRREGIGGACLSLLRGGQLRWGDQDALNTVLERRWMQLPRRWNVQSVDADGTGVSWGLWPEDVADAVAMPHVIHYTGRIKPWAPDGPEYGRETWYETLDRTSWRGWRPRAPHSSPVLHTAVDWGRAAKRALLDRPQKLPR
jgi:lipopolysaccharide biosynthesis glycosyltransferase